MKVDYLIVGQGLAGSALAMRLLEKGASILVIDQEISNSASRVAAGLVTTLAGKGMNPAWRQAEYLPKAIEYYRKLERASGEVLYHEVEVLKLFESEKQRVKFDRKKERVAEWARELEAGESSDWEAPHDGFIMLGGGWLDTNAYLNVVRQILGESYQQRKFDSVKMEVREDGVVYEEVEAEAVILCQGVASFREQSGLFSDIKDRSAKGEMLIVSIPNQPEDKIISKNGWLVPLGNQLYKVGATYEWADMEGLTTTAGREEVEKRLRGMLGEVDFEVEDHIAGVRPIVRKSQPFVGSHLEFTRVKCFNGLGSKGVITAPSVAEHFVDHLLDDVSLDPELDLKFLETE